MFWGRFNRMCGPCLVLGVVVLRRNVREGFPGEVTVEWVSSEALELTRFIRGMG